MRALFINTGGIGDQILLLPTVKLLKEKFPECLVDLICEPRSVPIRELTQLYRRIYEYDFKESPINIFKLRSLIRKQNYKFLFCTGYSYKANLVASLGNAEYIIGFKKGILSRLFLTHPVEINQNQYFANMFAELLKPILPEVSKMKSTKNIIPEIHLSPKYTLWAKEALTERIKEKYYSKKIFIHPGVSKLSIKKNILKSWHAKNWSKLIEMLLTDEENIVILLGGKDDSEIIDNIHKNLTFFAKPKNFFDLSKAHITVGHLASLISFSDLLICTDSAPMHIAVALGKKLIAFFGPTNPNKLLPKDPRFQAVYDENLECRPCLFDKRKESCGKPVCLDITPEKMFEAVKKQLIKPQLTY